MQDSRIINGLLDKNAERPQIEKEFYIQYKYFIEEGCRKFHLTYEDSFSAYSDAVMAAIHNIVNGRFDSNYSLKTYLFQIFSNKCVDLIRKITNNKHRVHQSMMVPELLSQLPETAKNVVEKLIDHEKIRELKQCLEVIGEKCKEILLLFEDGYTDKEIAERLDYNTAAVAKTTRLRCREKMKTLFIKNERHV